MNIVGTYCILRTTSGFHSQQNNDLYMVPLHFPVVNYLTCVKAPIF